MMGDSYFAVFVCIAQALKSVSLPMTNSSATSQKGKVWFITGASSGFGRLLAEHLLTLGANVVAPARRPETSSAPPAKYPAHALGLALDVTKPEQIAAAVKDAHDRFANVDVLVN